MHIETLGSGTPLVLIHGWAMHSGLFAPLTRRLVEHFHVHLVDLPGHGRSRTHVALDDPQRIASELAQAIPEGAVWAGWSLGGMIALHAAQMFPGRVRAVAAIASNPRFVSATDWEHGVPAQVFEQFAAGLERDFTATVERFLALEAMGSQHANTELRALRAQAFEHGPPDIESLRQGLRLLQAGDLRDAVGNLAVPSLWIAGRRDRLVPPQAMRWAADTAPRATHLSLDTGHMPFLAESATVAEALVALDNGSK